MSTYPECSQAYERLSATSRKAASFETKEAELLKLALSIGARFEGAAHSHARRAVENGASPDEVRGVALLAITTCGFPQAMMGLSWIEDVLEELPPARRKRKPSV